EERAVREVVSVYEEEVGLARGPVVELELGSRERLGHLCESTSDEPARDRAVFGRALGGRVETARGPPCPSPSGRAAASGARGPARCGRAGRSEEHTSEL